MDSDEEGSRKRKRTDFLRDSDGENGKTNNTDLNIKVYSFRNLLVHMGAECAGMICFNILE